MTPLMVLPFLVLIATPASAQAWIEYAVTGAVELDNREENVVMCSVTDEAFLVHTLGEWNVSIETNNGNPGEHTARFMVAAPDSIAVLQSPSVDDRLRGAGTVTITDGGMGQFGFPRVEVTYEAASLTSNQGNTIGIKGKFVCDVMWKRVDDDFASQPNAASGVHTRRCVFSYRGIQPPQALVATALSILNDYGYAEAVTSYWVVFPNVVNCQSVNGPVPVTGSNPPPVSDEYVVTGNVVGIVGLYAPRSRLRAPAIVREPEIASWS